MKLTQRRLTPEEEIKVDTKIKSIKRWLVYCPKDCPLYDIFEIIVLLQEDRRSILNLIDYNNQQYRE